jgi:pimeloyl-ACP methyl ester carboxylesterase
MVLLPSPGPTGPGRGPNRAGPATRPGDETGEDVAGHEVTRRAGGRLRRALLGDPDLHPVRRAAAPTLLLVATVLPLLLPVRTGDVAPEARAWPDSRFVEVVGVETHLRTWGPDDPAAPTVVALHHFYGSAATFAPVGEAPAAAGVRTVALDRPGFGLTERPDPDGRWVGPDAPYTRAFAARQAAALRDALGLEDAVLLGVSMGGTIALESALADPDGWAGVVAVSAPTAYDAGAPPPLRPALRTRWARGVGSALVRWRGDDLDPDRVTERWGDPSRLTDDVLEAYQRVVGVEGWDGGLWDAIVSDAPPALDGTALAAVEVPVVTVGGSLDRLVPASVSAGTALATGGTGVVAEGCGHTVHEECPEVVADAVLDLLAALGRAGGVS